MVFLKQFNPLRDWESLDDRRNFCSEFDSLALFGLGSIRRGYSNWQGQNRPQSIRH